jgi:hypothetical protein
MMTDGQNLGFVQNMLSNIPRFGIVIFVLYGLKDAAKAHMKG